MGGVCMGTNDIGVAWWWCMCVRACVRGVKVHVNVLLHIYEYRLARSRAGALYIT